MLFLPEEQMGTEIYAQASQRPSRRERLYQGATGRETAARPIHCAAAGIYAEGAGSRLRSNQPRFRRTMADTQVRHRPSGIALR